MTYETPVETASFEPVARLYGEPLGEIPSDLFIPPDALRIILEAFEGPLDLLLYLIRKHNLDVLDIPMAQLTAQYMAYVEMMRTHQLELAAEYLLMAALLMKSSRVCCCRDRCRPTRKSWILGRNWCGGCSNTNR